MSSVPNKKSKTSPDAELEAVRQHLLSCPNIPRNSRALQVALQALDQEQHRMDRDAKLQRKFASTTNSNTTANVKNNARESCNSASDLHASSTATNQQQDEDAELMEWQDVAATSPEEIRSEEEGSVLGKVLAQESITSMAKSNTTVNSPLGAIALALHASLCSDTLGFKCTGMPSSEEEGSKGFAAPIRELPKTQLVPKDWDSKNGDDCVKLRYRKDGVGSTVLSVAVVKGDDDNMVHVQLAPTGVSKQEAPLELVFALQDHVNLESLSKAMSGGNKRVVPTLHYKALPVLLTNMCNTFDLGPVQDSVQSGETTIPYVDTTIVPPPTDRPTYTAVGGERRQYYNQHEPPSLRVFQPEMRRPGDFDRDLLPSGGIDPLSGGNLMGPNHPAFGGPAIGSAGGGYGMRPRFDPYGPPGGPQDPGNDDPNNLMDPRNPRQQQRARPRPPPGGSGDPNPDHARPPNNLGNNMYM